MLHASNNKLLKPKHVIGLMSGTSMDGIDAALVHIIPDDKLPFVSENVPNIKIDNIYNISYPFPEKIKELLQQIIEKQDIPLKELCKLNFVLGEVFSEAVIALSKESGFDLKNVDLIGSHGQTIYHIPSDEKELGYSIRSTLQIGEPSVIAERTGVDVIADFRPADIAAGGEGAPLVCFADNLLFYSSSETRLVQNIGGISNVTVIPPGGNLFAFDNGPGNSLIDLIARKYFDKEYDKDALLAKSGNIIEEWIDFAISKESYYSKKPPKSTGRELFNMFYLDHLLVEYPISNKNDLIATVSALTSKVIAKSYKDFILPEYSPSFTIIGGGGAYNPFILENIARYLDGNIKVKTHEDFGISNNFKEAIAFAILAYASYFAIPNNITGCTGASKPVILGKFIPGKA